MVDEQIMLMGFLESLALELGIEFSPQEFALIQNYLRANPGADPAKVLDEIISIVKKKLEKTNKKLSSDKEERVRRNKAHLESLERIQKQYKPVVVVRKQEAPEKRLGPEKKPAPQPELGDKEIERIIDAAEKKLGKKLNPKQRHGAREYFRKNAKLESDVLAKANTALLGVLLVGVTGAVRPVVLQSFGNLLGVADMNPYHGLSDAQSTIGEANKIGRAYTASPPGLERAILNVLRAGNIDADALDRVLVGAAASNAKEAAGTVENQVSAPKLTPMRPPGSIDPFK